jgi:phage minor structural protein
MIPILYSPTTTSFTTGGIGKLIDAGSCIVTEERNGSYELEMTYPITGHLYDEIKQRSIIFAKPSPAQSEQPFRVYRITKPLNKVVTIYAAHISYDLSGIPVKNFTSQSVQAALTALTTSSVISNPFTFWSDKTNSGVMEIETPTPCRTILSNILDVYGGEYEFDKYTVKLHSLRGFDNGVSIKYGKNLTDLEQDENCSNVYTGVLPYWTGNETTVSGSVVNAPGTYDFTRILPVDFTSDFEEQPSTTQLDNAATNYISANNIGIPEVNLTVSFVHLNQTEEYKNLGIFERVELGDTIKVEFAAMGVSSTARCVKTVYNTLLERYDNVELGEVKKGLADTISSQTSSIIDISKNSGVSSAVKAAIMAASEAITGQKGGSVILHDTRGGNKPNELLFLDNDDISQAQKVWRFNLSGFGYSSNGYEGPFTTAITRDGSIVADFITTGSMDAARITAGILQSKDGRFLIDLTANTITMKNPSGNTVFSFDGNGNLTVSGNVTATGGSIAGFTINGDNLQGKSCTLYSQAGKGVLKLGGTTITGVSNGYTNVDTGAMFEGEVYAKGDLRGQGLYVYNGAVTFSLGSNQFFILGMEAQSVSWSANLRLDTDDFHVYRISSAKRFKRNIHDIREFDDVGDRIDRVRAVTFESKASGDKGRSGYGFIAEEMEQEFPWLTEYCRNKETGMVEAESVSYDRVPAILWADAQKTHERLKTLEAELVELKSLLSKQFNN